MTKEISTLDELLSVLDNTKFITSEAKLATYATMLSKIRSDLISDNLTSPSGLKGLSQQGLLSLLNGYVSLSKLNEELASRLATTSTRGFNYLLPNRNILINGAMAIDQRNSGASQTITAGSALAYTIDRWYAYCTGANATGQRVAGTTPNQFNYRFTGASSVSKIGFAQRIEAGNCQHLAGKTATLSVDLANSLLTTITWTAWYANTNDTFGTLASPTRTQIATGTFTVNSTLTRYATSIAIPAGATTGIEIELSVGAQTSGTWTIGRAQLEDTPEQTTFEYRPIQQELVLCQRYYEYGITLGVSYGSSSTVVQRCLFPYKVTKRTSNPSNSVSVLSGVLTSPQFASINEYNAWIGFNSTGPGLDGSFGVSINSEL